VIDNEQGVVRDVTERLNAAGIAFMVTGSMAMNYYAEPRMTRDIDVVIALDPKDAQAFVRAFKDDYYVSPEAVLSAISHHSIFNLVHQGTIIKVDFIVRKSSTYRLMEFERRKHLTVDDFETWVVSKEDLIISKMDWARESESDFQFRDIRNLVKSGCDVAYIDKWSVELNLQELWKKFRP
jgi:hypothetical protein